MDRVNEGNPDARNRSAILDETSTACGTLNKLLLNVIVDRRDNRKNKSQNTQNAYDDEPRTPAEATTLWGTCPGIGIAIAVDHGS